MEAEIPIPKLAGTRDASCKMTDMTCISMDKHNLGSFVLKLIGRVFFALLSEEGGSRCAGGGRGRAKGQGTLFRPLDGWRLLPHQAPHSQLFGGGEEEEERLLGREDLTAALVPGTSESLINLEV